MRKFFCFELLVCFVFLLAPLPSIAHYDPGYYREPTDRFNNRPDWMRYIHDRTRLSELAIPGTHDAGAFGNIIEVAKCQGMDFDQQLRVGVRYFDIRIRHFDNMFRLHHGIVRLVVDFDDFMVSVTNFLNAYPSETILFRLKEEQNPGGTNTRTMRETLDAYLARFTRVLRTTDVNLTLGNVRGRFIISCDARALCSDIGLDYDNAIIQDDFRLGSNDDLYWKWERIRDHLALSTTGNSNRFYMNYLSGSGTIPIVFPYFVASGHVAVGTSADRMNTQRPDSALWPSFPREPCTQGWCIFFEGTNMLARDRIQEFNRGFAPMTRTVGIIMVDFPGDSLIEEVVNQNNRYRVTGQRTWRSLTMK